MENMTIFDLNKFLRTLLGSGNFGKTKYMALVNLVEILTDSEVLLNDVPYEYEQSFLLKIYNGKENMPRQVVSGMQTAIDREHILASLKDHVSEDIYTDIVTKFYIYITEDSYLNQVNKEDLDRLLHVREQFLTVDPGELIYQIYCYVILNEFDIREFRKKQAKAPRVNKSVRTADSVDILSRSQLDHSNVRILCGRSYESGGQVDAQAIIDYMTKGRRWQLMSDLYKTMSKIRRHESAKGHTKLTPAEDSDLFTQLTDLISGSGQTNALNISGEYKSGKTIFLQALYYHILDRYSRGIIDFFPVYMDVSVFFNENRKNDQIKSMFKKAYKLAIKSNSRIVIILDGISSITNNDFDNQNRIKNNIHKLIDNASRKRKDKVKIVCSINTNADLSFSLGNLRKNWPLNSKNVMYINNVDLLDVYEDEKNRLKEFADAFIKFRELDSPEIFYSNLRKVDMDRISLNFFLRFEEDLSIDQDNIDIVRLHEDYLMEKKDFEPIYDKAPEIAFGIYFDKKNYSDLYQEYGNDLSYKAYDMMRQREMLFYLCAKYYLNTITEHEKIDSVLNRIYTKNITSHMLNIISIQGSEFSNKIYCFIKDHHRSMEPTALITLAFLLGRIDKDKASCLDLLEEILESFETRGSERNREIAVRSVRLAIIAKTPDQNKDDLTGDYLNELTGSERKRFINRSFQRIYYGDELIKDDFDIETDVNDDADTNIDYYNSFHVIASRLSRKINESSGKYPYKSIDLFTLCDLLNSRSRDVYAVDGDQNKSYSYFYHDSRHRMETLTKTMELVNEYLESGNTSFEHGFDLYLKETCKNISALISLDLPDISEPNRRYHEIDINDAYVLALRYLPQNINDFRNYSNWSSSTRERYTKYLKDDIIKMIQINKISDLNEKNAGDFFFSGSVDGNADLAGYYALWKEFHENDSINAKIAHDLLCMGPDTGSIKTEIGKHIFSIFN